MLLASLLYRFVSGSGLAYIYGFVLRSRGVSDPTVVRPFLEAARGGVVWGFDGGVGFSGLVSRSCFPFQISLCWSWCSRFGVEVSPLLRLVVIRGSMEVVIRLAWWFSRSVAASWRLSLPNRLWLVDVFLGDPSSFGSPYLVFVLGLLGCGDGLVLWRFWSHWFLCSRLPLLTLEVGSFMSLSIVLWFSKATAGVASSASLLSSVSRYYSDLPMKLLRTTTTTGELFWGYFFEIIGSVSFFGFVFAVIASTLLPLSQNPLNQGLKNDRYYYCFLVPLTIPVITVAVYFHWLSMKLFKHA
uniref:Uncharacterized protein n=1 Tax=Brassica campestris TaxID=3711 RepID=M4CVD3_BRACM